MIRHAASWRSARTPRASPKVRSALLAPLRVPAEGVLTAQLRRVARRQPDVFDRLGPARKAVFLICPDGLPFAFRLEPDGAEGRIRLVARDASGPWRARIAGPLPALLALFDASMDGDAAFFARTIKLEGDTAALHALHNALEAAELDLADLAPIPPRLRPLAIRLRSLLPARRFARR